MGWHGSAGHQRCNSPQRQTLKPLVFHGSPSPTALYLHTVCIRMWPLRTRGWQRSTCSFSLNVRPKVVSITFTHFLLVRIKLHVHGWLQRRLRNVVLSIQLKIRGLIHTEEGGTHVGGQVPITVTYPWPLSVLLPFTGNLGSVHYCTLRAKKIVTSTFMKCVVQT